MKKILIVGAYGCGNKGDDAILEGFKNTLGKTYEIISTEGKYGKLKEIMGETHSTISCRMNEGININVLINLISFFPRYYKVLKNVEFVIIGGGSLLHDITKYNLPFFRLLQFLAKVRKKSVIYAGVGAGPLQTKAGRKTARKFLNKSKKVFVRDPIDYRLLKEIGVNNAVLSADMAFCVRNSNESSATILTKYGLTKKEYIVVTACHWFKSDNFWNMDKMDFSDDRNKLISAINKLIIKFGKKVVFLPTVMHDYKLGQLLKEEINIDDFLVIDHNYNCKEMSYVVENSFFLFGTRMHSMIFAIRSGVPFVSTIYDNKVRNLLKRVDMLEYSIDFNEINTFQFESVIDHMLDNYDDVSNMLIQKAHELNEIVVRDMNNIIEMMSENK